MPAEAPSEAAPATAGPQDTRLLRDPPLRHAGHNTPGRAAPQMIPRESRPARQGTPRTGPSIMRPGGTVKCCSYSPGQDAFQVVHDRGLLVRRRLQTRVLTQFPGPGPRGQSCPWATTLGELVTLEYGGLPAAVIPGQGPWAVQ
jgi:hypothetical protein